ncbi:hypothetical protein CC2G_012236 [Coprinopsis cinerea AmutBmut pab1-1]|nr:hypothetical protein CC2G_012236 [Coprinopsis cinerea AmutBmut pab1-1]
MQFQSTLFALVAIVAMSCAPVHGAEGDVLTATKIFHTIQRESPFLIDRTTTTVWT